MSPGLVAHDVSSRAGQVYFSRVDYDHDGDLDLFSGRTDIAMYRNNSNDQNKDDETFTDVTEQTFVGTAVATTYSYPSALLLILMTMAI